MSWRDKGWNNPHKLPSDWFIYEAGADAMLEGLWEMARESPTGTFTLDSNTINNYNEGLNEKDTDKKEN